MCVIVHACWVFAAGMGCRTYLACLLQSLSFVGVSYSVFMLAGQLFAFLIVSPPVGGVLQ